MSTTTTKKKILHILSQRPNLTGSGVTLDAVIQNATLAGYEQYAIVGTPINDPHPDVGGLPEDHVFPLYFASDNDDTTTSSGRPDLPFLLPGMSDVMPYPSSRWSDLTEDQIRLYCQMFAIHVQYVIDETQPDLLYSHHIWLLSSILKSIAAPQNLPVVTHCHATGLRQMVLCPHLADRVRMGCSEIDQFVVLHDEHKAILTEALQIPNPDERIHVVGAGYNQDIFFHASQGRTVNADSKNDNNKNNTLVFAGKLSNAKGLPQLLDAVEHLSSTGRYSHLKLHVAGSGAGEEALAIQQRMDRMTDTVVVAHGRLSHEQLASLLRQAAVFVLPSFYEGLPLVVVEAAACGCRVVCTNLMGVTQHLQPSLGADTMELVPLPRLENADVPNPDDLPEFVQQLERAIEAALQKPPLEDPTEAVRSFTWETVFQRIETVWITLLGGE
jgi:glycosyltransferase involved in cell wall biosynthesis